MHEHMERANATPCAWRWYFARLHGARKRNTMNMRMPSGVPTVLPTFMRQHRITHEQQARAAAAGSTWHMLEVQTKGARQQRNATRNRNPMHIPPKSKEVFHQLHKHATLQEEIVKSTAEQSADVARDEGPMCWGKRPTREHMERANATLG